jgi:hypothetical protein
MAERAYNSGDAIIVVRRPVKIPFDTKYDIADLVIESDLAATHENAIISVAEVQAEEAIGYCGIGPSSAEVAADVKSGPGERRRHRDRGRRWRCRSHVGRLRRAHDAEPQQPCGHGKTIPVQVHELALPTCWLRLASLRIAKHQMPAIESINPTNFIDRNISATKRRAGIFMPAYLAKI